MQNNGAWIQTYTGRKFTPLSPQPEDVDIVDIAHALSLMCRFNGHCKEFYCPTPDQRVLTADLEWVPSGDLKANDELFGFDENAWELGSTGKRRRRFRHSKIINVTPVKKRILRLELEDGSCIKSSEEHPWLSAAKLSRHHSWLSALEIFKAVKDGRKRYLHKFISPWKTLSDWRSGWLAGLYDGEGYFSAKNRGGVQLGVSQNPGVILDEASKILKDLGFTVGRSRAGREKKVVSLQMLGGWHEIMRLLGTIRPFRLLDKFKIYLREGALGKQMDAKHGMLRVVNVYSEGEAWVTGIETSTKTYFCEGFAAHNSVAQHSMIVSGMLSSDNALWGLLHDATEAYLPDMTRPIKPFFPNFKAAESTLGEIISRKFGLVWPYPDCVKKADMVALVTELRDVMQNHPHPWNIEDGIEPLKNRIIPIPPKEAEQQFLMRFKQLTQ